MRAGMVRAVSKGITSPVLLPFWVESPVMVPPILSMVVIASAMASWTFDKILGD